MLLLLCFFTLFLQLYMCRAFLDHLQKLICCIGSCWLDKLMCGVESGGKSKVVGPYMALSGKLQK
jgi:hypothetical protein